MNKKLMDSNFSLDNLAMTEVRTSTVELHSAAEQNLKAIIPKIRIRLRPNSDQIILSVQSNVYDTLVDKSEHNNSLMTVTKNDYINANSVTNCYKVLEDSGGGGCCASPVLMKEISHSYMIHDINLRTRLPKQLNISRKLNANEIRIDEEKCGVAYVTENEFLTKSSKNSICTKNSYILHSTKNHRKKENNNRKSVSKVRNEIFGNINLKDIVNYENFLKLLSEIQWQLANLLPNCDKPKSPDNQRYYQYSDVSITTDEHPQMYPKVTYNALNNEFLGKALTKYSMKIEQCDITNLLTSDRENLRSRSLPALNEQLILNNSMENEVKIEESEVSTSPEVTPDVTTTNNNNDEDSDIKPLDDMKSSSSVCSTETMEMNGTENLFETLSLKIEQYSNFETKSLDSCERNYIIGTAENACDYINESSSSNVKDLVGDSQCGKVNILETREDLIVEEKLSPINLLSYPYQELYNDCAKLTKNLNVDTRNICLQLNTSDLFNDTRRYRKRKCFSISDDALIVPLKRSRRSTAGKRPARLNSESPPTSPSSIPNSDQKLNLKKFQKQKERKRTKRRSKTKQDNSSGELRNIIKLDIRSEKHSFYKANKEFQRIYPSSPESLPNECDMSPLSKPSPNGSSGMSNFCRSSLVSLINDKKASSRVNSVQALSPSWSCTSESTTPSVKSDYGHMQSTKTPPLLISNTLGYAEIRTSSESETKSKLGMPPPRQTLTLAAMRDKMRAKKLAKEYNRKVSISTSKRSSTFINAKNKRQNDEYSCSLKEGDDDSQMMDKYMNSSEEIDELFYNSQDSLLEFFMGDDNYDFDGTIDQSSDISTYSQKSFNVKKSMSKIKSCSKDAFIKDENPSIPIKIQCNKENTNLSRSDNCHLSKIVNNKSPLNLPFEDQTESGKSIADTIATVIPKLNSPKDNGFVINSNTTKTSVPSAYLVDGNGLSTALSIIQGLNPGAKVMTQQFYLVNSGPQLILQPSPPPNIVCEKLTSMSSSSLLSPNKVSLAPKISNQPPSIINRQQPTILSNPLPSTNDGFHTMPLNHLTFNTNSSDYKPINLTSESLTILQNSYLKMPMTSEYHNTYMMSPITQTVPLNQCSNALHLQTISTPHPIGLVHSVQPTPSLPSLRFLHPPLAPNQSAHNTISLIGPNISSLNPAITNNISTNHINSSNQSPQLLFLCPTIGNSIQSQLVAGNPSVINQDQKYLLLSKQPDKEATIQLVSSQGLWQQLNPTMISQSNNLFVMQPRTINSLDSLLSSNLHSIPVCCNDTQSFHQNKQYMVPSVESSLSMSSLSSSSSSSSLIIDSPSLVSKLSNVSNEDLVATSSITKFLQPSIATVNNFCSVGDSKPTTKDGHSSPQSQDIYLT